MEKFRSKSQKNTIRYSFFQSMSLTSIIFIILLFLGISVIFFVNYLKLQSKDSLHQLNYISGQFMIYLDSTDNYTKTVISDDEIQAYMKDYSKKGFSQIDTNLIKVRIRQIIQTTSYIHSVSLYSPEGTLLVSTEPFPELMSEGIDTSVSEWSVREKHSKFSSTEKVKVLSHIQRFYDVSSGKLIGYIEISIPESEISEIYKSQISQSNIFMIDSDGQIQSSAGSPKLDSMYEYADIISGNSYDFHFFTGYSFVFYDYFSKLNWYIISEIPLSAFLYPLVILFMLSVSVIILIIIMCVYVSHCVSKKITYPISYLICHMKKITNGSWEKITPVACNDELATLFLSFNTMIETQVQMRDDLVKSEKLKRKLSLDLLQEQINPHFLHNTLDNICSLAELGEKETLINLTMNFASFYDYCLNSGKMQITIRDELDLTEAYLKIMQIRYYNKFTFTIICPEHLKSYTCIKLLFQPIVENSIYHGIKEIPWHGRIKISAEDAGDFIRFTLSDNGKGMSKENLEKIRTEPGAHYGIRNIRQRIKLYYGDQFDLTMECPSEGGCQTIITISKRQEELPA